MFWNRRKKLAVAMACSDWHRWEAAKAQVKLLADADREHDRDVQETVKKLKESLSFPGPVYALIATYKNDRSWGLKEAGRF